MHTTIAVAHRRGHLSRHERLQLARAEAFSRRTPATMPTVVPVKLDRDQHQPIDQLVRRDRAAVSSALLVVAVIGAGEVMRGAVLAVVGEAARKARTQGAISSRRAAQIARHVKRAQRTMGEVRVVPVKVA